MTKPDNELQITLPISISMAAHEADQTVARIMRNQDSSEIPKRGRPQKECPTTQSTHFGVFVTDDQEELENLLTSHRHVVGTAYRGNKRRGKISLYADLLQFFSSLKARGITPPRNKSLSRRVCEQGIGEILRRHDCTEASDIALILNRNGCREKLAEKMNGIFTQIVRAL